MSESQYILSSNTLTIFVCAFAGIGVLLTTIAVALSILQNRNICKKAEKADLSRLSSIQGLELISDDGGDSEEEVNTVELVSKENAKKQV